MMMGGGGMGWMVLLPWLVGVALLTVVVIGAALIARGWQRSAAVNRRAPARELLDQRLARGEIDEDDYLRRLSALESGPLAERHR
jgi:putative membrane protein